MRCINVCEWVNGKLSYKVPFNMPLPVSVWCSPPRMICCCCERVFAENLPLRYICANSKLWINSRLLAAHAWKWLYWAAVAQESGLCTNQMVDKFDPCLPHSACRIILGQNTEPQRAPDSWASIFRVMYHRQSAAHRCPVWMCMNSTVSDRQDEKSTK